MKTKIIIAVAVVIAAGAAAYFFARPLLFAPKIVGKLEILTYAP
jgi:hypothetical protein